MTFSGSFTDSIVPEELQNLSVSFLVDNLEIRRGGVAGNIAFGLARLGLEPVLVGSVGQDFSDYGSWLSRHGVDIESVRVSEDLHTARFVCTTDKDSNQIATFYAGAMADARNIELQPVIDRVGHLDLVIITPNDPVAMARHTKECRDLGIPFAADPSQQLAFLEGDAIRDLIQGAQFLMSNEYESVLINQKTGWSAEDLRGVVEVQITTLGAKGCRITYSNGDSIEIPAVPVGSVVDPTGVGDAFRAGFLAGMAFELDHSDCARIGSTLAAYVIEGVGTQEYEFTWGDFQERLGSAYGDEALGNIAPFLPKTD